MMNRVSMGFIPESEDERILPQSEIAHHMQAVGIDRFLRELSFLAGCQADRHIMGSAVQYRRWEKAGNDIEKLAARLEGKLRTAGEK